MIMLFGRKGQDLDICGGNFGKQVSDLKSSPWKKGTTQILLRLEI